LLVKSFVEKNHGQVWIKSKEGIGTSFFISLPVNKPTC
jgi:signal transduction histidine kinase